MCIQTTSKTTEVIMKLHICSKPVWVSFFCWEQKMLIWIMNQTVSVPYWLTLYFLSMLGKSMAAINCLVTRILQNIFVYLAEKRNIYRCGTSTLIVNDSSVQKNIYIFVFVSFYHNPVLWLLSVATLWCLIDTVMGTMRRADPFGSGFIIIRLYLASDVVINTVRVKQRQTGMACNPRTSVSLWSANNIQRVWEEG